MRTGKQIIRGFIGAVIAIGFLAILIVGCGSGSGGGDSEATNPQAIDLINYEGPPSFNLTLDDGAVITKTIDSDTGGQVTTEGSVKLKLDIPPDAFAEDTTIILSLFSSSNPDNFTIAALFAPNGLVLNEAGTLQITFDPPLLPDQALYLLEGDSDNINAAFDTGLIVATSGDGSTVELPVEHFSSKGVGTEFVCHTQTNIRIIEWLLKKKFTQQQIVDEILKNYQKNIADALNKDKNISQKDPTQFIQDSIDSLINNQNMRRGYSQLLLKGLLKSYFKKTLVEADINNAAIVPTTTDCRNQLKNITANGDVAVVLFGSAFSNDPLSGHIPHSGATSKNKDEQDNYNEVPVIENAASVGKNVGDAWKSALQERKKQYQNQDEIPKVIPIRIDDLDKLRNMAPVNAVNQYLRTHLNITDSNALLNSGKKPIQERKSWGSARFYVPRDDLLTKGLNRAAVDEICPYEDPAYVDDIDHDGDGYTVNQGDCDDLYASVNPGAVEICDDLMDNDCNGTADCDDALCVDDTTCDPCANDSGIYVWFVDNLALKDVFVSSCAAYFSDDALCGYQGGGLDCTVIAEKVLLASGYTTTDEAINATCTTVSNIRPCGSTWFCGWLGDIGGQRHVIDGLDGCQ